jgi:hypothetical protein
MADYKSLSDKEKSELECLLKYSQGMVNSITAFKNGEIEYNPMDSLSLTSGHDCVRSCRLMTEIVFRLLKKFCNSEIGSDTNDAIEELAEHLNYCPILSNEEIEKLGFNGRNWPFSRNDHLIKEAMKDLQDSYQLGVAGFKCRVGTERFENQFSKMIPETCPWTLEELLEKNLDYLRQKLLGNQ